MGGNGGGVSSTVIGGIGLFADGTAAAPSISFLSDPDTGRYRISADLIGESVGGIAALCIGRISATEGYLGGPGGSGVGYLSFTTGGAVKLTAAGTAQNITLTPSTSGGVHVANTGANTPRLYIQTTNTATANGLLAFMGSAGTALLTFGTSQNITGSQSFEWLVGSTTVAALLNNGRMLLGTTTDSGALLQVNGTATFAGTIQPQLATTAGAPAYVKGAIYFDTTLNKLRVGGATVWETITSV